MCLDATSFQRCPSRRKTTPPQFANPGSIPTTSAPGVYAIRPLSSPEPRHSSVHCLSALLARRAMLHPERTREAGDCVAEAVIARCGRLMRRVCLNERLRGLRHERAALAAHFAVDPDSAGNLFDQ